MNNDLIIRPARKEDAELIAKVITMAINTDEGNQLFPVFCELASREFSQYSYHNCLVAEVDALPVGAIVGYDGARLSELREPIFELIDKMTREDIDAFAKKMFANPPIYTIVASKDTLNANKEYLQGLMA